MIVKDIKTENEFYNAVKSYLIDNIRFENKLFLTEELDFFNDYCICVGKGDKESQIAYLNSVQNVINEKLALATEENNKYKTLYVKLGILIGLMLFIAII